MQLLQPAGPSCRPMACLSRPAAGVRPIGLSSSGLAARRCGLLPLTQTRQGERQQQQQQRARPAGRSSSLQCSASAAAFAAASPDGGAAGSKSYVHHPGGIAAVFAAIRAVLFYCTTFVFASPLFLCMLAVYPYVLKFDKFRWVAAGVVQLLFPDEPLGTPAAWPTRLCWLLPFKLALRWTCIHPHARTSCCKPHYVLLPTPAPPAGGAPSTPSTRCGPS